MDSGKNTRMNAASRRGPEVRGGLRELGVDACHRREQRQDHVRQEHLGHPQEDAGRRLVQVQGLVDDAPAPERRVDEPGVAQDDLPGVRADQQARPERHEDRDQQQAGHLRRRDGHEVCVRVADEQARDRRDRRDPERVAQDAQVGLCPEEAAEVGEWIIGALRQVGDAAHAHDHEGHEEAHEQEHEHRHGQGGPAIDERPAAGSGRSSIQGSRAEHR